MEVNEEKVGKISITLYQNYSKQEQNILVFFFFLGQSEERRCEGGNWEGWRVSLA